MDLTFLDWADPALRRITVLRLRWEKGFPHMTVLACEGLTHDGRTVNVTLPFTTLPRKNYQGTMLDWARRDNVYLIGINILQAIQLEVF